MQVSFLKKIKLFKAELIPAISLHRRCPMHFCLAGQQDREDQTQTPSSEEPIQEVAECHWPCKIQGRAPSLVRTLF